MSCSDLYDGRKAKVDERGVGVLLGGSTRERIMGEWRQGSVDGEVTQGGVVDERCDGHAG